MKRKPEEAFIIMITPVSAVSNDRGGGKKERDTPTGTSRSINLETTVSRR
jgi:hypothetical protein